MRQRRHRGFTLVEMLVALSVASLLLALVYGAVRVGQRSVTAIEAQVEHSESMRIGWQFLLAALSEAVPMPDPEDDENRTSFVGAPESLAFVADAPPYLGLGGLMLYSLQVEENAGGDKLRLTRQRYDAEEIDDEAPSDNAVLVEQLDRLEISYFGYSEDADTPQWHSEWEQPDILPSLIQIQVFPVDGMPWPALVARPAAADRFFDGDAFPAEGEEEPEEGGSSGAADHGEDFDH